MRPSLILNWFNVEFAHGGLLVALKYRLLSPRLAHAVVPAAMLSAICALGLPTNADAQYGLYGAPDILQVSQTEPAMPMQTASMACEPLPDPCQSQSSTWSGANGPQLPRETIATPAPQSPTPAPAMAPNQAPAPAMQQNNFGGNGYPNADCFGANGGMNNGGMNNNGMNNAAGNCNGNAAASQFGAANGAAPCNDTGDTIDWNCDRFGGNWYGSLTGLIMGRSDGRRVWTSYKWNEETDQLANTQFNMEWKPGGEIRFGRRFCCSGTPCAIEASFWTAENFYGVQDTTCPGGLVSTPLDLRYMYVGNRDFDDLFDLAQEHRITRRDEYQNFEINLIHQPLAWACDSPVEIGWSLGVRYFRFQDFLQFASLSNTASGWDDGANVGYLSDRITNNLIGLQGGVDFSYCLGHGVRVFAEPKFGIYDNYMDATFSAYTGDGVNARGPYGNYPVHSTGNSLAFLTQLDVGVDWQFAQRWSARLGYRVTAVTGVGLSDDQFPQYICDTLDMRDIQHSSSIVLQGVFAGVTYNF